MGRIALLLLILACCAAAISPSLLLATDSTDALDLRQPVPELSQTGDNLPTAYSPGPDALPGMDSTLPPARETGEAAVPVPEPGSMLLLAVTALAVFGLLSVRPRR